MLSGRVPPAVTKGQGHDAVGGRVIPAPTQSGQAPAGIQEGGVDPRLRGGDNKRAKLRATPVPAWLGSFRKRSQSTKAPCGQGGFGTSLGGHGTSRLTKRASHPVSQRSSQNCCFARRVSGRMRARGAEGPVTLRQRRVESVRTKESVETRCGACRVPVRGSVGESWAE
jgi:hypothetical protein